MMNHPENIKDLLRKIQYMGKSYPREELNEIIGRKEEAVPALLKCLQEAAENPYPFIEQPGRMDQQYAVSLLALFQSSEGFPPFLATLRLPDNIAFSLYGEIFKDSGRILASMYSGEELQEGDVIRYPELEAIFELINDDSLDSSIRSIGFDALENLVAQNKLPAEIVQYYYHDLLQSNLTDENGLLYNELILSCMQLGFTELMDDIKETLEMRRIDPILVSRDDVEMYADRDKEEIYRNDLSPITDIHKEAASWPCFREGLPL